MVVDRDDLLSRLARRRAAARRLDRGGARPERRGVGAADPRVRPRGRHRRLRRKLRVRLEDKGAIVAFHWRGAPRRGGGPRGGRRDRRARPGGRPAHPLGTQGARGPPAGAGSTRARDHSASSTRPARGSTSALYVGDDATDLDAFRALARAASRRGSWRDALRVGVELRRGAVGDHRARPTSSSTGPTGVRELLALLIADVSAGALLRVPAHDGADERRGGDRAGGGDAGRRGQRHRRRPGRSGRGRLVGVAGVVGLWLAAGPRPRRRSRRCWPSARTQASLPEVDPARTVLNRLWPLLLCTIGAGALGLRAAAGPGDRGRVRDHLGAGLAPPGLGGDRDRGARRRPLLRRADLAAAADRAGAHARASARTARAQRRVRVARRRPRRSRSRPGRLSDAGRTGSARGRLGGTTGWRGAARELARGAAGGRRTGRAWSSTGAVREVRTFMLDRLRAGARGARAAASRGIADRDQRAIIYCSITAALLWPRPGAIWLDAIAAENRPGRHGIWQRLVERRRLAQAPLVLTMAERSLDPLAGRRTADALSCRCRSTRSGAAATAARDIDVLAYAGDPVKRRLDFILAAWARARREGETLVVAGVDRADDAGRRGASSPAGWRRTRTARCCAARACSSPRRGARTYGIAPLEALADGCMLVTTPAPGPYPALRLARAARPAAGLRGPGGRAAGRARRPRGRATPSARRRAAAAVRSRRASARRWRARAPAIAARMGGAVIASRRSSRARLENGF